jgi:hypothetical protein
VELARCDWRWDERAGPREACGAGRMTLTGDVASLVMRPSGLRPFGASTLALDLRADEATGVAITLKTSTGGTFVFGNPKGLKNAPSRASALATYEWCQGPQDAGGWSRVVVPFHDLHWWANGSATSTPIPNHEIVELRIDLMGERGATVDIARLCFGRPRTGLTRYEAGKVALGGRATAGATVRIESLAPRAGAVWDIQADRRGGFLSDPVPPGAYRVTDLANMFGLVVDAACDHFNIDTRTST